MSRSLGEALCLAACLAGLVPALPADAQTEARLALGLSAAHSTLRQDGPFFGYGALSGMLFGVEGHGSLWEALHARGEVSQGWLDRRGEGGGSRVLSARVSLGVRPVPWFAVTGGPFLWIVGGPDGDKRVIRWRVEAHGSGPLIPGLVSGFLTVGAGVAGTDFALMGEPVSGGGRAGIVVRPGDGPLWGALAFRMDRAALTDGSWQTAQTTSLTLGVVVP